MPIKRELYVYVNCALSHVSCFIDLPLSGLENAIRRHSSNTSNGAFSGKGQTLGDTSSSMPQGETLGLFSQFNKLDPQVKVLLYLLAGYLLFWYLK